MKVERSAFDFGHDTNSFLSQPCTTRDFMNYLIYIEHAAENLQFFLWYRDYTKRFAELPASERCLAPEWTKDKAEAEERAAQNNPVLPKKVSPETAIAFKGTDFAPPSVSVVEYGSNPFHTPPRTPVPQDGRESTLGGSDWGDDGSTLKSSHKSNYQKKAANAFEAADVKLQPCKSRRITDPGNLTDCRSHGPTVP